MAAKNQPYTEADFEGVQARLDRVNKALSTRDFSSAQGELEAGDSVLCPIGVPNHFGLQLFELSRAGLTGPHPTSDAQLAKLSTSSQIADRIRLGPAPKPDQRNDEDTPSKRPRF